MGTALFETSFFSKTLGFVTDINVIVPTIDSWKKKDDGTNKKYQVLYLFHGGHGNYFDFLSHSYIERYASERRLAVVMPTVANSFYQDMHYGSNYFTYITEELPQVCQKLFPISQKRENVFTGGVSMGGYGAFRVALTKPENYCSAISISGALDFASGMYESMNHLVENPFIPYSLAENPHEITGGDSDLFALARKLKESGKEIPKLYMRTGIHDIFCHHMNVSAKKAFEEVGIEFDYAESDAGHDWDFFSACIKPALDWLPLTGKAVEE